MYAKDGNIWLQTDGTAAAAHQGRQRLDAHVLAGRQARLLRPRPARPTARGASTASSATTGSTCPSLMQIPVDGRQGDAGPRRARRPARAASSGRASSATRSCRPTAATIAIATRPAGPDPVRRHAQDLRHPPRPAHRPRLDQVAAARPPGPGVAAGRRAARRTSATTATAPRARPGIYLYDTGDREGAGDHRPRLPPPVVLAGRQVPRGDQDLGVRDGRRDPQRDHRRGAPAAHRRRRQLGARLVAGRRPDRLPPRRRARSSTCGSPSSRAPAPPWTVKETRRPHRERRPRRRLAARLVRPRGPAASRRRTPEPSADAAASDRARDVPAYLERLAARTAATRTVLCVGIDPDADGRCPPASRRRSPASSAFARLVLEAVAARTPPRSSPTSRSSRRTAPRASPRSSGSARSCPADVPFVADAKRGDIGIDGGAPGRRAVRRARARTPSPSTRTSARRPIAPLLERGGPVRLRPVPDLEPRRGGAPGPRGRRGRRRRPARRAALGPGRPAGGDAGARAARSGSSSAPRRPPSWRRSGRSRRASRSSSRASGRRAARSRRCSRDGPATAPPAGGRAGGGLLVNVSRGIARAALGRARDGRVRRTPASASRRPPPTGPRASLCYPDAVPGGPERGPVPHEVHSTHMPFINGIGAR